MSTAAVPLIGLTAREVAGHRASLIATAMAAVYPNLWASDASVMSESLYVTTIALSLWMLCRLWRKPTPIRAMWAGVAIGLAALTRAEAILLLLLALLPICLMLHSLDAPRRVALVAAAFVAAGVVTSPWIARNLLTFDRPILLSQNSDFVIAGSNCPDTYYGPALGSWLSCNGNQLPRGDESVEGAELRKRGIQYARAHLSRLPVVVAARVGRAWDAFRPFQGISDVRTGWMRRLGVLAFWGVLILAVPGAFELHRRRVVLAPFLAQPVLVTLVAITGYGLWRLRLPLDEAALVLAAVTLARWNRSVPRTRRTSG
jgi:4-amino-4-deoxy-L-arabinose transferase-like glycosyltransferase